MKPGKLTLGLLLGKPKMAGMHDSPEDDGGEPESDDELPPGLLAAVSEFRSAETDEEAAKAFHAAMQCC